MESSSPSAEKPRLHIVGLGGTIMSKPQLEENRPIIKPYEGGMNDLVGSVAGIRDKFKDICLTMPHELIDSSQAQAEVHICKVIRHLRRALKQHLADVYLLLYGTDTMADLMTALGDGIPKSELKDQAVIGTCSMEHLEIENSDAYSNFRQAALLAAYEEVKGKVGLCVGGRLHPPRGIEKLGLSPDHAFACRFRRMAKWIDGTWNFDRESEPFDEPRGDARRQYKLVQGVECYEVGATSDYSLLAHNIVKNKGTVLRAPGNGNLRTDDESKKFLRKAAKEARGPIIVVGQAMNNGDVAPAGKMMEEEVYAGDASLHEVFKLLNGGAMTATEARIFLSHRLAVAESQQLNEKEKMDYIREQLALYPFREGVGATWRPKEKKA